MQDEYSAASDQLASPPRWPLWLAAVAVVLWLLVTVAAMAPLVPGVSLPEGFTALAMSAGVILNFAAPLAVLWFIALRLQDSSKARADRAELMAEQTRLTDLRLTKSADAIGQLEYRLSELTGQLTAMAKPVERQHTALAATITGLQQASAGLKEAVERTEVATSQLGSETPVATARAENLTALLDASRQTLSVQMAEAEALLERLSEKLAAARLEADNTAQAAEARINAISAATTAASDALAEPLGALSQGVDAALARTNEAAAAANQTLGEQSNNLTATIAAALADAVQSLEAQRALLADTVQSAMASTEENLGLQTNAINIAIKTALEATQQSLDTQANALSATIDEALLRTSTALDGTRGGVQAQTNAMLASVEQARTTIDHIGGEAATAIAARLASLTTDLTGLGTALDTQADRATSLITSLEDQIQRFDAALATSAQHGDATLTSVNARLAEVQSGLDAIAAPVAQADTGLGGLIGHMTTLDAAASLFFNQLSDAVPAAVPGLEDLSARLGRLHDDANALSSPIEAGADTLASAQSRLESAGVALEAATDALQTRLAGAATTLAALTANTENEAMAATASLLENFGRIKDIAAQSAGMMRETLSGVVAEAETALDRAATSKAEAAFGAPVRTALAALESQQNAAAAAAQAAAERVTNRLMALTQTVTSVETHFDKRQTEVEIRERSSLSRRAAEILASLKDQAIDLTRLLAINIEDQAYEEWLAGDRSRFLRGLSMSLDGDTGRAISRHLTHDAAFRADAARFTQDFEALIAHVTTDRQGRALAATLLASDPGKLYLAFTQLDAEAE